METARRSAAKSSRASSEKRVASSCHGEPLISDSCSADLVRVRFRIRVRLG